ncbi:MAG TPA: nucleotidyltransferase domain-containing protein [Vicinamibacteria bacterium]|nr:nucleotidyltransferase domain-containing protein [Vicinamibacteria bacterium]
MKRARASSPKASGRFVLRIRPGVHAALREAAADAGISLNDYCAGRLVLPIGSPSAYAGAASVVERAATLFGERLLGVAAFGSWARGELSEASDVDVLVVVENEVALTRTLYRTWDETPIHWGSQIVEPHFVHLPPSEATVSGLWCEVAVDGVVLFERGMRLSARLVRVRHDIVAGRIVRKLVHGQPYWAEVA